MLNIFLKYWEIILPVLTGVSALIMFFVNIDKCVNYVKNKIKRIFNHNNFNKLHKKIDENNSETNNNLTDIKTQISEMQKLIANMQIEMNDRLTKQDNVLDGQNVVIAKIDGKTDVLEDFCKSKN
jgi:hypothetical protein